MAAQDLLALFTDRTSVVQAIADGNATKRRLDEKLTISRSTIDRVINDLETVDLIKKVGDVYKLTAYGRLLYEEYIQVINNYENIISSRSLLKYLPEDSSLNREIFNDATVLIAGPPNPNTPLTQFEKRIRQSKKVFYVTSGVTQRTIDFFLTQVLTQNLQLSFLLEETVVEYLRQNHSDALHTTLKTDHCMLQSCMQTPPFNLALIDGKEVWLGIYDEQGHLKGSIHTESLIAVQWAKQHIQQYADQATSVNNQDIIHDGSVEKPS